MSLNNVPFDAQTITNLINNEWKVPEPIAGNEMVITMTGMANVDGFMRGTDRPVDNRMCNLLPLKVNSVTGKITLKEVEDWMKLNDDHFQNMHK